MVDCNDSTWSSNVAKFYNTISTTSKLTKLSAIRNTHAQPTNHASVETKQKGVCIEL